MSKSTHLLGKTSGRVGATVFKIVHGQQIVQEYQPKVANPNTSGQINQRARFKLLSQLAGVMAPYAVYTREGLTSPRNVFSRVNSRNIVAADGNAAAAMLDMQFAKGVLSAPAIGNIDRGETMTEISVAETVTKDTFDEIVYLVFKRNQDGKIALHANGTLPWNENRGAFDGAYPSIANEQFVYLYGVKFKDSLSKNNYENYVVGNSSDIATLISNGIISMDNAQFSETTAGRLDATSADAYDIKVYSQNPQGGTVAKTSASGNVTLTATPAAGYIFVGWRRTGTQEVVSTNPYTFVPVKNETFWGMFIQQSPQA